MNKVLKMQHHLHTQTPLLILNSIEFGCALYFIINLFSNFMSNFYLDIIFVFATSQTVSLALQSEHFQFLRITVRVDLSHMILFTFTKFVIYLLVLIIMILEFHYHLFEDPIILSLLVLWPFSLYFVSQHIMLWVPQNVTNDIKLARQIAKVRYKDMFDIYTYIYIVLAVIYISSGYLPYLFSSAGFFIPLIVGLTCTFLYTTMKLLKYRHKLELV